MLGLNQGPQRTRTSPDPNIEIQPQNAQIRDPATSPVAIRSVLFEQSPLKTGAIPCLSLLLGTACNEVIRVTLQNEGSSVDKMNTDRVTGIVTPKGPKEVRVHTGKYARRWLWCVFCD